jgi:chromosome segregation ATPase
MTHRQLTDKFMAEEDKSWIGTAIVSIHRIVGAQLTKLKENGAIEAIKPSRKRSPARATELSPMELMAAKFNIEAERKKAAAVKAKQYNLKKKAAIFELKAKADLLEQENAALKGALEAKAVEFSELNAQFAEVQAQVAAQGVLLKEVDYDLQDVLHNARAAEDDLQDTKATLAFVEADLMYQKVEVGMLKDELDDEQRCVASLNREANHLNTEVIHLRYILLLEFVLAVGAGIYLMVHYQPPASQLQIGY